MTEQGDVTTRWRIIRRLFHIALSITIVYYWLPDIIGEPGIRKWVILLIGGMIVLCIEPPRLILGKRLPWGRPYELRRPASYAYAAFGTIIVLLLFPPGIGAPAIAAMALADPVAGELRRKNASRLHIGAACGAIYAIIALILASLILLDLMIAITIAIPMTIIAVITEDLDLKALDDDLTMIVLPATIGYLLYVLLTSSI